MKKVENMKKTPVGVYLDPEVVTWLKRQARKEKRSLSSQVAFLLQKARYHKGGTNGSSDTEDQTD